MASPARRLSTRQLLNFLDVDSSLPDFIDVHAGNEANLSALFDRIAELQEKSPADYERLNAAIAGVENPDDMVEAIGREIYPPVKTGIQGKDPKASQQVEERLAPPADPAETTALANTPAPKEPAAEAAPAAKRGRGRPRKNPQTDTTGTAPAPAPEAAAPAVEPAAGEAPPPAAFGPTDSASFGDMSSANPEVNRFDVLRADPTFRMDATPGGFAAADPFGVGLEAMMAGKFGEPPAGMDAAMLGSTPMRDVMPPVPNTPIMPQPPQRMPSPGMSAEDEINALASLLYEGGDTPPGMSSPGFGQDDVDIPDFSEPPLPQQQNPWTSTAGMFPETHGPSDPQGPPRPPRSPWTSTAGMFPETHGPSDPQGPPVPVGFERQPFVDPKAPWRPTNSMAEQFFKAIGTPGYEKGMTMITSPFDTAADVISKNPGRAGVLAAAAGLGGYAMTRPTTNPYAATPEEEEAARAETARAEQELLQMTRRGVPRVIPSER